MNLECSYMLSAQPTFLHELFVINYVFFCKYQNITVFKVDLSSQQWYENTLIFIGIVFVIFHVIELYIHIFDNLNEMSRVSS